MYSVSGEQLTLRLSHVILCMLLRLVMASPASFRFHELRSIKAASWGERVLHILVRC